MSRLSAGEMSLFVIGSARITKGEGRLTINDGRIVYDYEGIYDQLARDATETVEITYAVVDDNGVRQTKKARLDVTGGNGGANFLHEASGQDGTGSVTFSTMTAAEMLQDVLEFATLTPVDIDVAESLADGMASAKVALQGTINRNQAYLDEAKGELGDLEDNRDALADKADLIATYTGLSAELAAQLVANQVAVAAVQSFDVVFNAYRSAEVEERAAVVARVAEDVLNGA